MGIPQPQYFITLLLEAHWTYFWEHYIYYKKDTKVGSQNFGYQIWFCTRLVSAQAAILYNEFENHTFGITATSPRGQCVEILFCCRKPWYMSGPSRRMKRFWRYKHILSHCVWKPWRRTYVIWWVDGVWSIQWSETFATTVRCRYNAVGFLTNIHKIHPIARPLGRGMGCLFLFQHLIDILFQFL